MTKDRLQEMKKLMQEDPDQDGGGDNPTESTLFTFFELARTVKQEIENLKNKVNDLKILLHDNQQWSNTETRNEIERKIEEKKLVIGNMAYTMRQNLKTMKTVPVDQKRVSVIQRIKSVQINAVVTELNDVLRDYLQCLVDQRERSVKFFKDMLEVRGDKILDLDSLLEEGKIAIFTNNLLIRDMEEKYSLRESEETRQGILNIESSILEIKNLFNELALIVDLQGEKVMEVEKLVDDNLTKIESGKSKLTSASRRKKKFRYQKLIVALICGGIIITVVVAILLI